MPDEVTTDFLSAEIILENLSRLIVVLPDYVSDVSLVRVVPPGIMGFGVVS